MHREIISAKIFIGLKPQMFSLADLSMFTVCLYEANFPVLKLVGKSLYLIEIHESLLPHISCTCDGN